MKGSEIDKEGEITERETKKGNRMKKENEGQSEKQRERKER